MSHVPRQDLSFWVVRRLVQSPWGALLTVPALHSCTSHLHGASFSLRARTQQAACPGLAWPGLAHTASCPLSGIDSDPRTAYFLLARCIWRVLCGRLSCSLGNWASLFSFCIPSATPARPHDPGCPGTTTQTDPTKPQGCRLPVPQPRPDFWRLSRPMWDLGLTHSPQGADTPWRS